MNNIWKFISNFREFYNEINSATLTGAIDVVVVEQPDGTYLSSPFHVRFGKMGVLRSREKVVDIEINGEPVDIHMKLGDTGEAFFVEEIESDEEEEIPEYLATSPLPEDQENAGPADPKLLAKQLKKLADSAQVDDASTHPDDKENTSLPSNQNDDDKIRTQSYQPSTGPDATHQSLPIKPEQITDSLAEKSASDPQQNVPKTSQPLSESPTSSPSSAFIPIPSQQSQGTSTASPVGSPPDGAATSSSISKASPDAFSSSQRPALVKPFPHRPKLMVSVGIQTGSDEFDSEPELGHFARTQELHKIQFNVTEPSPQHGSLSTGKKRQRKKSKIKQRGTVDKRSASQEHLDNEETQFELEGVRNDSSTDSDEVKEILGEGTGLPRSTSMPTSTLNKLALPNPSTAFHSLADLHPLSDGEYGMDTSPQSYSRPSSPKSDTEYEIQTIPSHVEMGTNTDEKVTWQWGELPSVPPSRKTSVMPNTPPKARDDELFLSSDEEESKKVTEEIKQPRPKRGSVSVLSWIGMFKSKESVSGDSKDVKNPIKQEEGMLLEDLQNVDDETKLKYLGTSYQVPEQPLPQEATSQHTDAIQQQQTDAIQVSIEQESQPPQPVDAQSKAAKELLSAEKIASLRDEDLESGNGPSLPHSPKSMSCPSSGPQSVDSGHCGRQRRPRGQPHYRKSLRLSSEVLEKLDLHEDANEVVFSVTTAYQGTTTCRCHIYLWRWDDKIIVSDIDGTITKSDVLGHILPIIGRDWAQSGVANLFTRIRANGYKLLYLSARAIGQARITRDYLRSVKQGQLCLPDGPLLLSPTSLISAFHREVIEKKPEEFKISCLKDIQALFPSNPFYAGFGNKINDTWAYRAIDIPLSRIFTVNHRGELKLELIQTFQSSYTRLSDVVDQVFPPLPREGEDPYNPEYGNCEFWRIPVTTIPEDDPLLQVLIQKPPGQPTKPAKGTSPVPSVATGKHSPKSEPTTPLSSSPKESSGVLSNNMTAKNGTDNKDQNLKRDSPTQKAHELVEVVAVAH